MPVTVETAALQQDGIVYTLPRPARHCDIIHHVVKQGVSLLGSLQGFVLSDGTFVDRYQAARVAYLAGQIEEGIGQLYTEDLW
jgi:hypothetical protein